jgi:uncharacterized protein (DUF58 family)
MLGACCRGRAAAGCRYVSKGAPMPVSKLLDDRFLNRLEYFRVHSKRPARGHWKGVHRANKTGSGMEFSDFRPYSEGDDLKNVDWRTYMRLNRLILRLYEEEADLPIYLFVDSSASMRYGAPSKFDYARKVAAALAYVGFVNMDRVSLIAVAEGVVKDISGKRGKSQAWPAFDFLEGLASEGKTSLQAAFKRYFATPRTKGVVLVISDFLDPAGFEPALRVLRQLRQEVFAVHVIAEDELAPALPDEVVLVDAEDGSATKRQITPALISAYRAEFERYGEELESYCSKNGWGYVRAVTSVSFEDLVLRVLRQHGLLR